MKRSALHPGAGTARDGLRNYATDERIDAATNTIEADVFALSDRIGKLAAVWAGQR